MKKKWIAAWLGISVLALSACANEPVSGSGTAAAQTEAAEEKDGASAEADDKAADDEEVVIHIAGGPSTGANYTTFSGIANLIMEDHPNYLVNTEISTGSTENINMILSGTAQFGVAMADVELAAGTGTREYDSPVAISHVMGGYTTIIHMFVPENSDVQSVGDLKGKKLAVSKGTMAQYYMPILLEAYGLTEEDVTITELALQDICDAVNDGNADFGVHVTPYTSSPIADLAATKGIRLLGIDEEHIASITEEYPYFYECVIPGGIYSGIEEDTVVIGTRNNLIAGTDVDEEVVYNVVKTIIEHEDDLADIYPQAVYFNKENAVDGVLIDIHPGAARYYKEIGIMED